MIRAILDANVHLSFLVADDPESSIVSIMRGAFLGRYRLLINPTLVGEVARVAASKPYFISRLGPAGIDGWLRLVAEWAEQTSELEIVPERMSPDRADDYLITHAIFDQADYLVSGDRHLHAVKDLVPFKIVTPAEFAAILDELPADA